MVLVSMSSSLSPMSGANCLGGGTKVQSIGGPGGGGTNFSLAVN